MCVLALEVVINWCSTQYEVMVSSSCAILLSKYAYYQQRVVRVGPAQTGRAFVLLCVNLNLKVLLVFDVGTSMKS